MLFPKEMTGRETHKRRADDTLDGDQRLAKRLNLLHIGKYRRDSFSQPILISFLDGRGKKPYVPVTSTTCDKEDSGSSTERPPPSHSDSEWMQIEETKDRVFIHDIDEELAEIESDDEHPIFLPDIEKHLIKIPHHILVNEDDRKKRDSMQLILYNVPSSLSVPESKDSVRRAILESRQRTRQNQGLSIPEWSEEPPSLISTTSSTTHHVLDDTLNASQYDEDAMDTT